MRYLGPQEHPASGQSEQSQSFCHPEDLTPNHTTSKTMLSEDFDAHTDYKTRKTKLLALNKQSVS